MNGLRAALRREASRETVDHAEIDKSASQHGEDLFNQGLTVAQVVHDYGDLCQVGVLAHEMRNLLNTALMSFQSIAPSS